MILSHHNANDLCLNGDKHHVRSGGLKALGKWIVCSAFLFAIAPTIASAQSLPQSDRRGDYYKNETPVIASTRSNPGSLWSVVPKRLNCRRLPSINSPITRVYKAGDLLEVEIGRGGSDEVLLNPIDSHGKPWMPVRRGSMDDKCYVRANTRFIQPVTK